MYRAICKFVFLVNEPKGRFTCGSELSPGGGALCKSEADSAGVGYNSSKKHTIYSVRRQSVLFDLTCPICRKVHLSSIHVLVQPNKNLNIECSDLNLKPFKLTVLIVPY